MIKTYKKLNMLINVPIFTFYLDLSYDIAVFQWIKSCNIYIFIAIALDESIFLDVLHFPMKNIKSRGLEATPMGGLTSKLIQ